MCSNKLQWEQTCFSSKDVFCESSKLKCTNRVPQKANAKQVRFSNFKAFSHAFLIRTFFVWMFKIKVHKLNCWLYSINCYILYINKQVIQLCFCSFCLVIWASFASPRTGFFDLFLNWMKLIKHFDNTHIRFTLIFVAFLNAPWSVICAGKSRIREVFTSFTETASKRTQINHHDGIAGSQLLFKNKMWTIYVSFEQRSELLLHSSCSSLHSSKNTVLIRKCAFVLITVASFHLHQIL